MRIFKLYTPVIFLLLIWSLATNALDLIPPVGRVVDQTETLNASQKQYLIGKLQQFESQKGSQIAVLIIPSTAPETIEEYGIKVAQKWKLGRKNIDDGAILIIAKNDRRMRIEVGYGLEGALNDAVCKRIISEIITPYFRQNDFYDGIVAGTDQMMKTVEGEPLPPFHQKSRRNHDDTLSILVSVLVACLYVALTIRRMVGKSNFNLPIALGVNAIGAAAIYMFTYQIIFAIIYGLIFFGFTLYLLYHNIPIGRGHGGDGSSGGFFGGSGGGGGFSGGGGGFGGGGSSGGW
jgi:uncharacterized protein